ncbi:multicopper oxidase 2A [Dacryopinax primogenitus]|uniref:Multicopper oxidase 2A n=1 Tax=Dacryopinax primogenitus (strain DJM 731) TaxID=1858805 RepID=M5FU77_DACPD|nr:multicopper oxidase 2A [Dacryopinax primogenitus]EJT99733.1 multicopper oxidase 2A [Dacryopinax primogenitus]
MTADSLKRRSPLLRWGVIALVAIIILALALGIGLGLGLKHSSSSTSAGSSSSDDGSNGSTGGNGLNATAPPLSNFALKDIRNDSPQVREYTLVVQEATGSPDSVFRPGMLVVNGTYPGPTLVANQNDRMIIHVINQLPNSTAIHWHGLYQNSTPFYDGTNGISQCGIPPSQSYTYNYTFGDFSGSTWYHAHYSTQYTDGVVGALIVNPSNASTDADGRPVPPTPAPTVPVPAYDQDIVVVMQDWYHTPSPIVLALFLGPDGIDGTQGDEPTPESGTMNGLGQFDGNGEYFNFSLEANMTYRFRLVNTGSLANIRFSIDDHPLLLVSADGVDVVPQWVSGVELAVAQRYDVLVRTNETSGGQWWVRGTILDDMFAYSIPDQELDQRGILSYPVPFPNTTPLDPASADPGPGANISDLDTSTLVPSLPIDAPEPTHRYPVTISFQETQDDEYLAFLNNTSWYPLDKECTMSLLQQPSFLSSLTSSDGPSVYGDSQLLLTHNGIEVVDLLLDNLDEGDHPFHMHGHRPWVMGSGAGRYQGQSFNLTNPMRRDTHLIPAYSWVALRFITDNPGMWAFHCHIAWHMSSGLLMQINNRPQVAASYGLPDVLLQHCAVDKGSEAKRSVGLNVRLGGF